MPTLSVDMKQKRSRPRQWGCLLMFLFPFVLCAACRGGLWVFARYGGEWVARQEIPLPEGSQRMTAVTDKAYYICERSVFFSTGTPRGLRKWFQNHHLGLTPIDEDDLPIYDTEADFYEDLWSFYDVSTLSLLHQISASMTSSWSDEYPAPHHLKVFISGKTLAKYYPDLSLPDGMTAFELTLCWPNVK
jgi:hypothetical protein